ncbi:MAG: GDYXXLXY domain-containing protein [Prosthecobacter sp.]|uniref:GDYXXLXY domain-containing protein n=1 Tax=Prosthecobacter sp. TaxID=1965333 RepID=UPI003903F77A
MKTLPFIIFALAALAQWAAPLSQIWTHEQTLAKGTLIKLKCTAPDPYDPLRGRFLAVRPEQRDASLPEGMKVERGLHVFATLTTGADGLATITSLSLTPPATGDYIRVKAGYSYDNKTTSIDWPFERFYINEKLAPEADKWFAENIRSAKGIIAEVRVLNGRAVLADLSLDGKPFREILKERVK